MEIDILGFQWDSFNLHKLKKHDVSQEEAEEIFYNRPIIDEGAYAKRGEKKYRCLGKTNQGRFLAAFFTIRTGLIRNISVRTMRKKEEALYEKKKAS